MTDYTATPGQWADVEDWAANNGTSHACILELRARVEALEAAAHKHIVETNSNIVALFTRVESLEATERGASKVYEISKPLKLTPDQVEQLLDQLRPTFKRTPSPSQNHRNTAGSATSGWKHARLTKENTYRANYRYPGENRTVFCGTYKTAEQAHYMAIAHKLENYWRP